MLKNTLHFIVAPAGSISNTLCVWTTSNTEYAIPLCQSRLSVAGKSLFLSPPLDTVELCTPQRWLSPAQPGKIRYSFVL